ncbi:MAG: hypothetical protein ACOCXT_02390 [Candidatus Dojkabacteria bacterium]
MHSKSRKLAFYVLLDTIFWLVIGTFEIAFIYRLAQVEGSNPLEAVLQFFFILFSTLFVFFLVVPRLLAGRRLYTSFILNHAVKIVMCLVILFFFNQLHHQAVLFIFAALKGLQATLYFYTYHYAHLKLLNDNQRFVFDMKIQSLITFLPVIIPFITGLLISQLSFEIFPQNERLPAGYSVIFVIGIVISFLTILFSPKIKEVFTFNFTYRKLFQYILSSKSFALKMYMGTWAMKDAAILIGIGVLSFLILEDEIFIGLFSSIISLAGTIYFLFLSKHIDRLSHNRFRTYLIGAAGDSLGKLILSVFTTLGSLIWNACMVVFLVPLEAIFGNNIALHAIDDDSKHRSLPPEMYIIMREVIFFPSRVIVIGIGLLLANYSQSNTEAIRTMLLLIPLVGVITAICIFRLDRIVKLRL